MYEEEREIDLIDLLYHICIHWRRCLIFILIMVILSAGYTYWYNLKKNAKDKATEEIASIEEISEEEEEIKGETVNISNVKDFLTNNEIEEVDIALMTYEKLHKNYEVQLDYYENSIWSRIDEQEKPVLRLEYNIDNHYQTSYPILSSYNNIYDIVSAYNCGLSTNEMNQKIAECLSWDILPEYACECLLLEQPTAQTLLIGIVAPSLDERESVAQVVREKMEEITPSIKEEYGNFSIHEVASLEMVLYDTDGLSREQSRLDSMAGTLDKMKGLSNDFTEYQKVYYFNSIGIGYSIPVAASPEETEAKVDENDSVDENVEKEFREKSIVKMIVIGIILGIALHTVLEVAVYVMDGVLHTSEELSQIFKILILGIIPYEHKTSENRMDKFIKRVFGRDRVYDYETQIELAVANIKNQILLKQMKKLYLINSSGCVWLEKVHKDIMARLSETEINITCVQNFVNNSNAIENLIAIEGAFILEEIGRTKIKDIAKEITLCKDNNIPILGSVIVE